jgi:hypothetical protein
MRAGWLVGAIIRRAAAGSVYSDTIFRMSKLLIGFPYINPVSRCLVLEVLKGSVLSLLISIKGTHASRLHGARARPREYTFYRFYIAPCGAPHTTPADRGISINLFSEAPAARSHASVCFHKTRKAHGVRDLGLVL